jgi:hypothetical protein
MPGLSQAPLQVKILGQPDRRVDLMGGLVGVVQQPDGALAAHAGWFVQEARAQIDEVIEKLKECGVPSRPAKPIDRPLFASVPAELVALDKHFDGAVLPCGWSLRPAKGRTSLTYETCSPFYAPPVHFDVFADLPDGSCLAFAEAGDVTGVLHIPPDGIVERTVITNAGNRGVMLELGCDQRNVAWIADSITEVLLRALDPNDPAPARRKTATATLMEFAPLYGKDRSVPKFF